MSLTHQVEIDTMIDQIILARLYIGRSGEIYAVHLAHVLYLLPRSRHAQDVIVELGKISPNHLRRVPGRIAADEHRPQHAFAVLFLHLVDHPRHLIELFGANVRTMRETEVYETVPPF